MITNTMAKYFLFLFPFPKTESIYPHSLILRPIFAGVLPIRCFIIAGIPLSLVYYMLFLDIYKTIINKTRFPNMDHQATQIVNVRLKFKVELYICNQFRL